MRRLLLLTLVTLGCSSGSFDVATATDGASEDTYALDVATDGSAEDAVADSGADTAAADTTVGSDAIVADANGTDVPATEVPPPACDPAEQPPTNAVFASVASGDDTAGDGSQATPYKTIAKALASAKAKLAPRMVLDQGTYAEVLVIGDTDFPLTIEGGWKRTGAAWARVCSSDARALTLLQAPAVTAVSVNNTKQRTGLARMTIQTKAQGGFGQSVIAIIVRGTSTFFLDDVVVKSGIAGAGAAPMATPPTPAAYCDGYTFCTANGVAGGPGGSGSNGTKGTFVADGYQPGHGTDGVAGVGGSDGPPGGVGASSGVNECNYGCSSSGNCDSSLVTTVKGKSGKCGCGGVGGAKGLAGRGGGASIALYAFGPSVAVDVKHSSLTAADGGAGSAGGLGGDPSAPSAGSVGASSTCDYGGCTGNASACYPASTKQIAGGPAGGSGHPAGKGGNGGGGSGGPAHTIVSVGAAVTVDAITSLVHGAGGAGAGGAPAGSAAPKLTQ